jgi:hypothetical protein
MLLSPAVKIEVFPYDHPPADMLQPFIITENVVAMFRKYLMGGIESLTREMVKYRYTIEPI